MPRFKLTPDQIQSQIDTLKAQIISGVSSAGYGDKRTEFRSLTDLRQILAALEEDLAEALGAGGRIRQIRMTTQADKGL
jgi:3-methyladenine DNA glycosylase/8-oxoguanine DNA glycosylase